MKNKLAIFDLDGTLFDTKDVNYYAYKDAMSSLNYNLDYGYFCEHCNGRHYMDFLPDISSSDLTVLEEIHISKKSNYHKYVDKASPNRHLIEFAKLIKKEYYIAIVTTASKENTIQLLEAFDLIGLFELILTQEDVAEKKPSPEGFNMAMQHFNVRFEDTVIFEDSDVGEEAAVNTNATYFLARGFFEIDKSSIRSEQS